MNKEKDIILETLMPIVLDEDQKEKLNYKNYEKVLDSIFASKDFCNIALTGPYGAGKSTIMYTYEQEHKELKSLHISLAKINEEDIDNMQAKLINQIIHQVEPKQIPQTQFKVKRVVSVWKVVSVTVVVFVFLLSMCYLFTVPETQLLKDSNTTLFEIFWTYKLNIAMLIAALLSSLGIVAGVVNAQLKKPLIKAIHVDKSQIDLVESETAKDNAKEKFDKYMDEIIYLFQRSKVDVLVIEDLDRFEDVEIFYELRQMNYLLNKKYTGKKNKVKFIYMVKDELFKNSEERTKFFDIIVPIVPAMDNSNSYELMKKMLGEEWLAKLDKTYLKTICLYIRDYRILKNIFNEFQIYYYQLRIEEHQYKIMKLLAMITYKNLWPTDFAMLQQGEGSVYRALNLVEELRKNKINALHEQLTSLHKKEEEMEAEVAESIDELDAIYFEGCPDEVAYKEGYYSVNGKNEQEFSSRKAFIHELKKTENVIWYLPNNYSPRRITLSKESIKKKFDALEQRKGYAARKERILERYELGTEKIENEIAEIEQKIIDVAETGFKELLSNEVPESIASLFPEDKKLIRIFLQDEMIGQDYAAYMTYFYPYSITNEELRYLNKVYARTQDEEQQEIEIVHPELVLEYLKESDWSSVALPNKMLYKYLVKQGGELLRKGIQNLRLYSNVEFAIVFLQECVETGHALVWVNYLQEEWGNFIEKLIGVNYWNHVQKVQILLQMLTYMTADKVPFNTIKCFLETIEPELKSCCNISEVEKLKKIGYRFRNLNEMTKEMENAIYANSMYQITKENIEYILYEYYGLHGEEKLKEENFTTIMSNPNEPLAEYIAGEPEPYIEAVYIPHYAEYSKESKVLLQFLNNNELDLKLRMQLVEKMNIVIEDIREIGSAKLRNKIVAQQKMKFTNINVISIWESEEKLTDELHHYLKQKYQSDKCNLSFIFAKKHFGENKDTHPRASKLVRELLSVEDFGEAYDNLLKDVDIRYTSLDEISWKEEQLGYIVKTRTIDMTEKNLRLMRELENLNLFYLWLKSKVPLYLTLLKKEELRDNKELQKIIAMPEVSDNEKISCIEICTQPVPILESYNTHVVEKIFEKDLFDGNFEPIIRRYNANRYGKQFMQQLGDYMVSYISSTININIKLPYDLLMHVLQSTRVATPNKKRVLAKQVIHHSFETINKCMELAGAETYLRVFIGQKPRVDATEADQILIEALVKRGWISSYKADEDKYILYSKKAIAKI